MEAVPARSEAADRPSNRGDVRLQWFASQPQCADVLSADEAVLLYRSDSSTTGSVKSWAPTWKAVMEVNISLKLIREICRSLSAEN